MSTELLTTNKLALTQTALSEGVGVQVTGLQRDQQWGKLGASTFTFAKLSESEARDLRDSLTSWLDAREQAEESTRGSRTECRSCPNTGPLVDGLCGDCFRNNLQKKGDQ